MSALEVSDVTTRQAGTGPRLRTRLDPRRRSAGLAPDDRASVVPGANASVVPGAINPAAPGAHESVASCDSASVAPGTIAPGSRVPPQPASDGARPAAADGADPRRFLSIGPLTVEAGGWLPDVTFAYETWGALSPACDNAVLVLHALTGDSHASGEGGWWSDLIGPGRAIDTDRFFVVAPNALGGCRGTTGPSSAAPDGAAWGSRFPAVTIRDQVAAEIAFADALGIDRWALVIGGSAGGARALEWAVTVPDRVERVAVLACGAATTPDQVAWALPQLAAIRADAEFHDGDYHDRGDGPVAGLKIARQIAHATYRSANELDSRFEAGAWPRGDSERSVRSYFDHQADKLVARFDAGSYLTMTEAILSHDVGRDRGSAAAALARVTAEALVIAVTSDRLYLPTDVGRLARALPHARFSVVQSERGHDGFLTETEQVGAALKALLA